MRILLVEDNPCTQLLMRESFLCLGHTCRCVQNGQEALAELMKDDYDVVFMDLEMPVMDGFTAARMIRSEISCERQPVIVATSAHAGEEKERQALEAGINLYLTKPATLGDIEESLAYRSVSDVRR